MAIRFDRGELRKPVKLPNGWLKADGFIARSGILEYRRADGTVQREYRSPEENARADMLDSFALVPLTLGHPPSGLLTADNTKAYQAGTIERPTADGELVRAGILVTDADAIEAIEAGAQQLSMGYVCDLDFTPGEVDGQRYDAKQINIRGNHVALVRQGRAGPQVRLRVDSADAEILVSDSLEIPSGEKAPKMNKVRIDDVEYEVSETAAQAIAKLQARADVNATELATAQAKADASVAEVAKLKAELEAAPEKIRAEITARVALETKAGEILGESKFDGKSDLEIKQAVAEKVNGVKLAGKSEAYVVAAYDLALERAEDAGVSAIDRARAGTAPIRGDSASDRLAAAKKRYDDELAKVQPR